MIEKNCKICGKPFLAKQSNYLICSDECRKINEKYHRNRLSKRYDKDYRRARYGKGTDWYAKHYVKTRVIKHCKVCNCELPNGHQTYCLNCLLDMWANGNKKYAMHVLSCRGYDKTMILDEIAERRNCND